MSSNTPQLRFAEFSGEWTPSTLKEVSGKPMYGLNTPSVNYDGENGYIRITDIDDKSRRFIKEKITSPLEFNDDYLLNNNDILFTRTGASVGKSYKYSEKDGKLYFAGFLIKFPIIKASTSFVFFQTLRSSYDKWVLRMSMRSGQPGINAEEYSGFSFLLPCIDEQQKIGSFLSAVDSKIEGLEQELGLLKRYKQGIMQRLFNQTLRFKDNHGNPFPDWQDVSIKEIGEVITGSTPSKTNDGFWEGSFPWATAQDFKSKYISTTIQTLSEQGKKKSRIIPKNSVLITCIASIGLNAINKVECATNQQINAIVCNEKYDSEFIYYAIGFNNRSLKNLAGQTAVPIVTKTAFESFRLFVAKDKVEQKKIANFLSAIDEKIEAKQNQITTARNWKKSLLQKMFV